MTETIEPEITDLNTPFWLAATAGRLVLPHCVTTGKPFWPPSPLSPFTTNGPVEWKEVEPQGVLRSVVTYRRVFQKVLSDLVPYRIGLVELTDEVRLQAYLAGASQTPSVGDEVRINFTPLGAGTQNVPTIVSKCS